MSPSADDVWAKVDEAHWLCGGAGCEAPRLVVQGVSFDKSSSSLENVVPEGAVRLRGRLLSCREDVGDEEAGVLGSCKVSTAKRGEA
jgi:hypothetical protein